MALRLNEEHQFTGSGLGYQMSSYALMRSLCNRAGLKYAAGKFELLALKNTFESLEIDEEAHDKMVAPEILRQGRRTFSDDTPIDEDVVIEFLDQEQFEDIIPRAKDGGILFGYPTPINSIDETQITDIKKHFTYRGDIQDICKAWKQKMFGDTPVISMHFRRGDFTEISSGMFLIDDDYYIDALKQMPEGLPVLIFTNDKDYILNNPKWQSDRFTLVTDLSNDNNMIDCEWMQMIDEIIDESGMGRFYYKMAMMLASQRTGVPVQQIAKELAPAGKKKIKNNWYNYSFDHCMMHLCDYHIMANSTYGLWGVEMSNSKKVVYPKYWMQEDIHGDESLAQRIKNFNADEPGSFSNWVKKDSLAATTEQTIDSTIDDASGKKKWTHTLKPDMNGFDQTATIAGHFINDKWVGLDNPDQRAFTFVKMPTVSSDDFNPFIDNSVPLPHEK
tara:strand:- start:37 stop:1374 length:1338 start_codon:yes stop_codon:yes gene_type:complete